MRMIEVFSCQAANLTNVCAWSNSRCVKLSDKSMRMIKFSIRQAGILTKYAHDWIFDLTSWQPDEGLRIFKLSMCQSDNLTKVCALSNLICQVGNLRKVCLWSNSRSVKLAIWQKYTLDQILDLSSWQPNEDYASLLSFPIPLVAIRRLKRDRSSHY